ncbi:MAG: alpha/beta fold hydrolase [Acidobacteriota bacterium]
MMQRASQLFSALPVLKVGESDDRGIALRSSAGRPGSSPGNAPAGGPPERPERWQEAFANRLFLALSPRVPAVRRGAPSKMLAPYERFTVARSRGRGTLSATWYPALGAAAPGMTARGAVLLVHPWVRWGQAYFERRGRLGALRAAGYHAMTFDLGGFGSSTAAPSEFYDRDIEDALKALRSRAGDLPLHLWGVSSGGYWAHALLSRRTQRGLPAEFGGAVVHGAVFEDVAQHLIEWSGRMAPWGKPCYAFFRNVLTRAYRFMDLSRHAPHLRVRSVGYISGELDRGVLSTETRRLARLAHGRSLVIQGADHLEAIKKGAEEVLAFALDTFELAEGLDSGSDEPDSAVA